MPTMQIPITDFDDKSSCSFDVEFIRDSYTPYRCVRDWVLFLCIFVRIVG